MRINPTEKQKIYKQAKHRLGAPIRKIQLEEEQMDSLLEIAVEDYVEFIHNWLIEHQWPSLIGLNITEADLNSIREQKKIKQIPLPTKLR